MFILQDGKLHIHNKKGIIGIEVYPDNIVEVKGTETKLKDSHIELSALEVWKRYNILESPYIYPKPVKKETPKKEVKDIGTVGKTKVTSGKSK